MELENIAEISTWDSGGGQVLDLLTLKDGRVLVISEESVVLYESMEDLEEGEANQRPTIFLHA
jgi:hypothetical protein